MITGSSARAILANLVMGEEPHDWQTAERNVFNHSQKLVEPRHREMLTYETGF